MNQGVRKSGTASEPLAFSRTPGTTIQSIVSRLHLPRETRTNGCGKTTSMIPLIIFVFVAVRICNREKYTYTKLKIRRNRFVYINASIRMRLKSYAASCKLSELEEHLRELTGYNQTKEHLQNLQNALAEEFNLDKAPKLRPKQKYRTTSQLRRALLYARKKIQQKTAAEKNEVKRGIKLKAVWIVRSMLASPSVSQRTLAEFCADFPETN